MTYQIQLSETEYTLIQDLLENERQDLHTEVRRSTKSLDAHEQLQQRLHLVDTLLERIKQAEATAS